MQALIEIGLSNAVGATVFGAIVTVVTRLWRRPAIASALWLLVFVKLVTPPMPWPLASPSIESRTQTPVNQVTAGPKPRRPIAASGFARRRVAQSAPSAEPQKTTPRANKRRLPPSAQAKFDWSKAVGACRRWLPPIWGAGGLLWFGLACIRLRRFGRLLKYARPAPAPLCSRVAELARQMGLQRCPELRVVEATIPPLVWIVTRRAMIALPAALLRRLSYEQQETLVAHELAHLRRRDHWTARLELIGLALYWWHPMVWWARRELHRAQEACCDGWVVWALPGAAVAYAKALLDTVDFLSDPRPVVPPLANAFGEAHSLRRRLEMILHERIAHRLSWPVGLGLMLIAAPLVLWTPAVRQAKADVDATEGESTVSMEHVQQRLSRLEESVALLVRELGELRANLQQSRVQPLADDEVGHVQELSIEEEMQTDDGDQVLETDETAPALDAEVIEEMELQEPEHEANESDQNDRATDEEEHEDDGDDGSSEQASEANGELPHPRVAALIREHKRLRQRLIEIEEELEEELGRRLDP